MSGNVTVLPEVVVTAKREAATGSGTPAGGITTPDPVAAAGGAAPSAAALNDPSAPQTATRQPLVRVLDNGQPLAGVIAAEVEQNSYYACDHFHLTFAASAGPPGWFDYEGSKLLDTQFSLDNGGSWTSFLVGEVDHRIWNPETGILTLEGRDLSARFIEQKTQESFVNQTSSQVAQTLAERRLPGVQSNITATTALVGRYYESDHVAGSLDQFARTTTEWDMLIYLAQRENFSVFMEGTQLHFEPITLPDASPYVVQWTPPSPIPRLNAVSLRCERSDTLAKDIQVQVKSWNSRQGRGFIKTARASGTRKPTASPSSGKSTTTQNYVFIFPNLTEDQAQQRANQLAIDLTKHERVISVELPGDLTLRHAISFGWLGLPPLGTRHTMWTRLRARSASIKASG